MSCCIQKKKISGVRSSKHKTVNQRGETLLELIASYGLPLLNGRAAGDQPGEFTFIGAQGCLTFDQYLMILVEEFQVVPVDYSDLLTHFAKIEARYLGK